MTIVTASDVDRRGHPARLASRFAPTAGQVTALIHVGTLPRPGTLAIDWYATDSAGKEFLITERSIPVDGREWAWSIGHAARPVPAGLYEVVARINGSELATWFYVGDLQPPPLVGATTSGPDEQARSRTRR